MSCFLIGLSVPCRVKTYRGPNGDRGKSAREYCILRDQDDDYYPEINPKSRLRIENSRMKY